MSDPIHAARRLSRAVRRLSRAVSGYCVRGEPRFRCGVSQCPGHEWVDVTVSLVSRGDTEGLRGLSGEGAEGLAKESWPSAKVACAMAVILSASGFGPRTPDRVRASTNGLSGNPAFVRQPERSGSRSAVYAIRIDDS